MNIQTAANIPFRFAAAIKRRLHNVAMGKQTPVELPVKAPALPHEIFPLSPPLPLPAGFTEKQIFDYLSQVATVGAPAAEMLNYCRIDFKRFLYTFGLLKEHSGKCLELGSNPYFTTFLLREFTDLDLVSANYFSDNVPNKAIETVAYKDFKTGEPRLVDINFDHFNIEKANFPYEENTFDVVLFCEIIEHLLNDPMAVLLEIKRILKPGATLILTTPNVCRLENIERMLAGQNIYDPYSNYGPYGRHNREYTKHDLYLLLNWLGFEVEEIFSADVNENSFRYLTDLESIRPLIDFRRHDLGQYIFLRARNSGEANLKKPSFLYRSYPSEFMDSCP